MWGIALFLLAAPAASTDGWINDPAMRHIALSKKPVTTPVFKLNLDLPPKDRWTSVLKHEMFEGVGKAIQNYFDANVPPKEVAILTGIAKNLQGFFPEHYSEEMQGVAKILNIPVGSVVLTNLVYALEQIVSNCTMRNTTGPCLPSAAAHRQPGACTSFVANGMDGTIWHGRNLDWNLPEVLLRYTLDVEFQRGGKTVFTGTTIPGLVGVMHGIRHGAFSLSQNARDEGGETLLDILQLLLLGKGVRVASQLMRDTLETQPSFDAGLHLLKSAPIVQHAYYILGGTKSGEGAVLARNRDWTRDLWLLNETDAKNTRPWFILQTNYDHWTKPPSWDDRLTPGNAHMEALGQAALDEHGVARVLNEWPTMNQNTDMSAIMNTAKDVYRSTVWLNGKKDMESPVVVV